MTVTKKWQRKREMMMTHDSKQFHRRWNWKKGKMSHQRWKEKRGQ